MSQEIVPVHPIGAIAKVADQAARQTLLYRYQQSKSAETLRRQSADIALFERYLARVGYTISGMKDNLSLWAGVSYGIVAGFQQWQLQEGYSIGRLNVRMTTIRTYC